MYNVWDREWQYGLDGNKLVVSLEVGNNFAVNVEEEIVKAKSYALCVAPNHYIS